MVHATSLPSQWRRHWFVCLQNPAVGTAHTAMVGGNPFAKREGGAQKEDLLAGAERSDALWHDEEEAPRPVAQPSSSFGRRRHSTSLSPESAQTESRAAVEPGAAAAELGSLPPPPPLVPPPSASEPPALGSAQEPLATGTAAGTPYYPPAPGTSGAWGSNPYGSNPYGGSPYGGVAPPGVPPPAGDGPYGAAPGDYYSTQPAYGQPAMAPAWTAGYPAADQPLTYQTFEQQGGGPPPGKMRCGGLGEQWTVGRALQGVPLLCHGGLVLPCCALQLLNSSMLPQVLRPAYSPGLPDARFPNSSPRPPPQTLTPARSLPPSSSWWASSSGLCGECCPPVV